MRLSTSSRNTLLLKIAAIAFWLLLWQGLSRWVNSPILLVSPVKTLECLFWQLSQSVFWRSVGNTTLRILLGFMISAALGILLAVLAYRVRPVQVLLAPLLSVMQSVPIASVIILILLWVPARSLSVLISALIGLPIIYSGTLNGLNSTDEKLIEMAECFHVPFRRQWRHLYFPHLAPFLQSALGSAIGLSWKSGIAAEVIGIPAETIGEKLYQAKVYLETPELFSWTVTVILLSVGCEWSVKRLLKLLNRVNHDD